jgi:DNA-binding response OmpR family regulator
MIVDDEVEMSRLLKMLLEMEGFTVETSTTGSGALEKAAVQAPNIFMVDYHLRDMSGEELIRQLRTKDGLATTPIIVASGRDVEPEVRRAGATEFMLKPFEPDELIAALKRLTDDKGTA